jgi:hypothetical protein
MYYEQCLKLWLLQARREERREEGERRERGEESREERERRGRKGGSIRPAGTTGEQDKSCSKQMC